MKQTNRRLTAKSFSPWGKLCVHFVTSLFFVLFASMAEAQVTSALWGVSGEAWNTNGPLRDFTDVGYMSGDVAIPDWPVGVIVTNFGAIPDDGIDDSQAFIDAIAACPSNHAVFVPNGKYIITDQLRPERSCFVLRGEDMYQTILYFPKNLAERYPITEFDTSYGFTGFFYADGGTHKSIENLTFEFRRQTKMGHWEHRYPNAINYGDVEDSWIRNIYIKNADDGIVFTKATRVSVLNVIMDHSIERPDFIGSSGVVHWIGHLGIGMGNSYKCLFHNIEFKAKFFHEFDIINVPSYCVVSSVKGSDMALHNHGKGAHHNLYTEVYAGTGTRIFGALTDAQRVHHETYWNIDADELIDPAMFTDSVLGSNVFIGVGADYDSEVTDSFYYEDLDPAALTPSNIYLAQLVYRGKPLPEAPPPQPPTPPELTGDIRILNPTDDITFGGDPLAQSISYGGTYLKFNLSDLTDLSTIAKARLRICTKARKAGSGSFTMSVSSVADDSWTQFTLTNSPAPAVGSALDSVLIDDEVVHKWWELDITSFVQSEWSGGSGDKVVSLKLDVDRTGTYLGTAHSIEDGNAPLLLIERVADPVSGPPAAPVGMESISTNGWVRLNWADNTEADFSHYNVYCDPAPNRDYPIAQDLMLSEFNNISDVENWPDRNPMSSNTVFRYSVTAVDEHGYESERTDLYGSLLNADNNPPAFSAGPHSLTNAMTEVDYSESVADTATDLESDPLYFFKVSGPAWLNISSNGTLNGTPPLSAAGTSQITVQVNSIGGCDQAVFSLTVDALADDPVGAPAAPANVVAASGDGSVSLDWDDNNEGDLDSYSVYRSTISSNYGAALATDLNSSDYVDNTAVNDTTYYYVVTAMDFVSNESAQSSEVSATPQAVILGDTTFVGNGVSGEPNNFISTTNNWDNGLPVGQQGTISIHAGYNSDVSHAGYDVVHTAGTISRGAGFAGFNLGSGTVWLMDGATAAITQSRGLSLDGAQFTLKQGNAALTDNGRDTTVQNSGSLTINGGTMTLGRDLIINNGAEFTITGGTLTGIDQIYCQSFRSAAAAINFNGGTTTANGFQFDTACTVTFGGSAAGSLSLLSGLGNGATLDWQPGTKMSMTVASADEWAEAEWNAGRLKYNGADFSTLGTWTNVTAQDGLEAGARFAYDSATETLSLVSTTGYDLWATKWNAAIGAKTNDFDADGMNNFCEYVLGGNPTNVLDTGMQCVLLTSGNSLLYVHPKRSDDPALIYTVETRPSLLSGAWTKDGYVAIGTNLTGGEINFITNDVRLDGNTGFLRLKIEQ